MTRSSLAWISLLTVGLACAPTLPDPTHGTATRTAARTAAEGAAGPAPNPLRSGPVRNDPDPVVPEDYAGLRAELDSRSETNEVARHPDPLAPMREHLSVEIVRQIGERRAEAIARPPRPALPAEADPEYAAIAAEIAEDAQRREEAALAQEERFRRDYFAQLEEVPLEHCVPTVRSIGHLPGDLIQYRALERADFRARKMDRSLRSREFTPGAHVAVSLACVAKVKLAELAPNEFEARLDGLQFVALLDRDQSWWNDRGDHVSEEWTLRHEQVHFDIVEMEARRLNTQRDQVVSEVRGRGATPVDAVRELRSRWARYFAGARQSFLDLSRRYDHETRHGQRIERQTEWFARTKRGLARAR